MKVVYNKESGSISHDFRIDCGRCTTFDLLEGNTLREATKCAINDGWEKDRFENFWICPGCVEELKEKENSALEELLAELYEFIVYVKEKSTNKDIQKRAKEIEKIFFTEESNNEL